MVDENKVSRRNFLKGAAVGTAAIAGVGLAPVLAEAKNPTKGSIIPTKWDEVADVVIAGYGSTGLPAAIEAHDAGARVLIIDKND